MADNQQKYIVIGLMSGTSMDGLDAVLFSYVPNTSSNALEVLGAHHHAYSSDFRKNLLDCIDQRDLEASCRLSSYWAEHAAQSIHALLNKTKHQALDIDIIASHGQTLLHHPQKLEGLNFGYTLQIGAPSFIAQHTGITCIGNFRQSDIAQSGEGAPLLPVGHTALFPITHGQQTVHNLGGISNLTVLARSGAEMAFDTGPANMWIDAACRHYSKNSLSIDRDGELAKKGIQHPQMLEELLKHPFFDLPAPKSTGYESFGVHYLQAIFDAHPKLSLQDAVATVTEATALSIARAYQKDVLPKYPDLKNIIFSGGGCFNPSLLAAIKKHLPDSLQFQTTLDHGFSPDHIEAIGFGILGVQYLNQKFNISATLTQAKQSSIGGEMAWGSDPKHLQRIRKTLLASLRP